MKIVFSEEADSDLLHIFTYLSERNRNAAVALSGLFNTKLESLVHFPFIGRDRSILGRGLRSVAIENYVVFYRVERDRTLIVRVFDGRRDIDAEFER
ncbi:MAG TPA: type II toxin-antitoxin system RelE/ParE family toxin [Pseudolabrys sp.]|jgi:toxin ParE1/3/4